MKEPIHAKVIYGRLVVILLAIVSLGLVAVSNALAGSEVSLKASDETGIPEGFTSEEWLAATATATVTEEAEDQYTVVFEASNVVPNGTYTLWWVKMNRRMQVGPAGGVPANTFTADPDGNASATITVPADNEYEMLVVAYHPDGQTHGDSPGEMGVETFQHVKGPFPRPE